MNERIQEKLSILADAAKYDVSCASSGSNRKNHNKGLGNSTGMGICHTYTEDGRCVSLLKILLTNYCIFDCAYCVSRISNDVKRAAFKVQEVVDLTVNFYRRNYIEGLFLSSGIFKNPDYTMERLVKIAQKLREEEYFNGYIHLKTIPGASPELMELAGRYADRLSVNIELPTPISLKELAPDKDANVIKANMKQMKEEIDKFQEEKKLIKHTPHFAPAGQSTQMIIGASPESDQQIIHRAEGLYKTFRMRRVYYSGYIPIRDDNRLLPGKEEKVPMLREHRLYQSDWLMRFYGFKAQELLDDSHPHLDLKIDPKLSWALRHLALFPIDLNTADYEMILRVPGIGVRSAKKIVLARKHARLNMNQIKRLKIAFERAKYFVHCGSSHLNLKDYTSHQLRDRILGKAQSKFQSLHSPQLSLFDPPALAST